MQGQTLIEALVSAQVALDNCKKGNANYPDLNQEWIGKWSERIKRLCDLLPSGSGIDTGTSVVEISTNKVVLACSFHHMNEHGSYNGWTDHTITIRPDFLYKLDIKISGKDRNEIKDYLHDVYYTALTSLVPSETPPKPSPADEGRYPGCEDSPDGMHAMSHDQEYAQKHHLAYGPICCEYCGLDPHELGISIEPPTDMA